MKKLMSKVLFSLCFSMNAQANCNEYEITKGLPKVMPPQTISRNTS